MTVRAPGNELGNRERVLQWLELLKRISPHPEEIEQRISEVSLGLRLEIE